MTDKRVIDITKWNKVKDIKDAFKADFLTQKYNWHQVTEGTRFNRIYDIVPIALKVITTDGVIIKILPVELDLQQEIRFSTKNNAFVLKGCDYLKLEQLANEAIKYAKVGIKYNGTKRI